MDELVRWLGEQLDEDERIARATHPTFLAWEYDECVRQIRDLGNGNELANVLPRHAYGEHMAEHDPARVLREIEAKRRVLRMVEQSAEQAKSRDYVINGPAKMALAVLEPVLLHAATVYADRPGYRKEWRP